MTINTQPNKLNKDTDFAYHEEANVKEAYFYPDKALAMDLDKASEIYLEKILEMRKSMYSIYSSFDSTEEQIPGDIQDAKEGL